MSEAKNKVTDWRIIGVSGETADGRQISAADLEAMAATYDPAVYGARINLEHQYFTFPGWAGGFGDVVELKTQTWHKDPAKTALLAKLSVLPNLQQIWDSGEKIYTSMEIMHDFAGTGRAYLVGLAITDNPASLGTTANFTAAAARKEAGRSLTRYHISESNEMSKSTPLTAEAAEGIFARLLAKFNRPEPAPAGEFQAAAAAPAATPAAAPAATPAETPAAPAASAEAGAGAATEAAAQPAGQDLTAVFGALAAVLEKLADGQDAQKKATAALSDELAEFKQKIEAEPHSGERAPHTGAAEAPGVGW